MGCRRDGLIIEDEVEIGENFDCGYYVVLRKGCKLGDNVKIWSNSVIDAGAKIGNNVRIHCNCYISQNVVIEDNVFIGPGTVILNDRYPPRYDPKYWEPPIIRESSIIGGGVVILPGSHVGQGTIIGGGATVVKEVPPREIWAGHPARRLR